MADSITREFGYKDKRRLVFRETFTGDGAETEFQLTSSPGNVTFVHGGWEAADIQYTLPGHATKINKKSLWDSIVPITRNKIEVSSISAGGLVTLNYAPQAEQFYVWYWYELDDGDTVDDYYREEFVATMEMEQGTLIASSIITDTTNFDAMLSSADDTVQKALDTLDDHLHVAQTLQNDGITPDSGTLAIAGLATITKSQNATTYGIEVINATAGTGASAGVKFTSAGESAYVHLTNDSYTTVAGWADALIIGTNSGVDGGILNYSQDRFRVAINATSTYELDITENLVSLPQGVLGVGVDDSQFGSIYVYGQAATSTAGGQIRLYTAADHDTNIEYFIMQMDSTVFRLGPNDDTSLFSITYVENVGANFEFGKADDTPAWLYIYGGQASNDGGRIYMYTNSADDDAIQYYNIIVEADDMWIGPDINANALKYAGLTNDWRFEPSVHVGIEGGFLHVGAEDVQNGTLRLYGNNSTTGGAAVLYTGAGSDDNIQYYQMWVNGEDWNFGHNVVTNFIQYDYSNSQFDFRVGKVGIGVNDSASGALYVYGNDADGGGQIYLYTGATSDDTIGAWRMQVNGEQLLFGPDTDTDLITITVTKDVLITDGDFYVRNDTDDVATVYIGKENDHRGELIIYGDDATPLSNAGGRIILHTSNDYDTAISDYRLQSYQDDFWIGAETDPDMLRFEAGAAVRASVPVYCGFNDSSRGLLYLYGDDANNGGQLLFFMGATGDTDVEYYSMYGSSGSFLIGSNVTSPLLQITAARDFYINNGDVYIFNASDGTAQLHIGLLSDTVGYKVVLNLNPDTAGSTDGGMAKIYVAPDHDTVVDYYALSVYQDDLYIGPDTNSNMIKLQGTTAEKILTLDADMVIDNYSAGRSLLTVGSSHVRRGVIYCYSQATLSDYGGALLLFTNPDDDDPHNYWQFTPYQDDFYIGPDDDPNLITIYANKTVAVTDGNFGIINHTDDLALIVVGLNHNTVGHPGRVDIAGHTTGETQGGSTFLYTAADHDTLIDYYEIEVTSDDFTIGPNTDPDMLKLQGTAAERHFIVTDADMSIRNPTSDVATLSVGQAGQHRGTVQIHGQNTGSTTGGLLLLHTADDHDTNIQYWRFNTSSDDLYIGTDVDVDVLKITYEKDMSLTDGDFYVKNPSDGTAVVYIGQEGNHGGGLYIYGGATNSGGVIFLYNADDDDTTNNLWQIQAYNTELIMGPQADPYALTITEAKDVKVTDGDFFVDNVTDGVASITVGSSDLRYGYISLAGHATGSAQGGQIYIATAADHDTNIDNYQVRVVSDDLWIGPDTDTDMIKLQGLAAERLLYLTDCDLTVGNDTNNVTKLEVGLDHNSYGSIRARGMSASSTQGGQLLLFTAADHDTVVDYYILQSASDDLLIGTATDTNMITLSGTAAERYLILTDANLYVRNPTDAAALIYAGQEGSSYGHLSMYGAKTGSTQGAVITMRTADDHDANIESFTIQASSETFIIGSNLDTDGILSYTYAGGDVRLNDFAGLVTIDSATAGYGSLTLGKADDNYGSLSLMGNDGNNGGIISMSPGANFDDVVGGMLLGWSGNGDQWGFWYGWVSWFMYDAGDDFIMLETGAATECLNILSDGSVVIGSGTNNRELQFKASTDKIFFDGTDLNITCGADLEITCGTDKTLELQETVWDDYVVPITVAGNKGVSNNPTLTQVATDGSGSNGVYALGFSDDDEGLVTCQMPHRWKEGTTIYPHIHWAIGSDVNPTDKFDIEFEYWWGDIGEDFPANTTLVNVEIDTGVNTAAMHQMSNVTAAGIDGTGHTVSSVLVCRIQRVEAASVNYALPVYIFDFDLHYEVDTMGSRQIGTK